MPQATDERVARINKWKGLNVRETANALDDEELTDVVNFDLSEGGELVKRTGFKTVHGLNRVVDTFTRADNPASLGSTEAGVDTIAHVWSVSGPDTWGISLNRAFRNGALGHQQAVVELGGTDHEVEAEAYGTDYTGLVTRYVDTNNHVLLQFQPDTFVSFYAKIAGAYNPVAGFPVITWAPGDRFKLRTVGQSWSVFKNGVMVFITTTPVLSTGTKGGMNIFGSTADGRFDNFAAIGYNSNSLVLGANSVKILGFFNTNSVQQFVARAGNELYTSTDAITWTIIPGGPWGNVEHGVQYTDKFYMVRRDSTIIQWDGTTASAIAGTPTGSHCKVFKDRLFVVNSYAAGSTASRIYFSDPFDFSATGWPATNYVGVGEGDGDVLVAVYNVQDYLVVFKAGATWILYVQGTDTLAWILRPFNAEIGCVSKNTILLYEGVIYFLSVRGVYQTDGNSVKNLSESVSPVFDSIIVSSATLNASSAFIWQDRYVLALETFPVAPTWASWSLLTWSALAGTPWSGSGATYTYLVYHVRQKGWTKWRPAVGFQPHVFVPVILSSAIKGVYAGDRALNGKVYKFGDPVYQDDITSYEVLAETKEFDFDAPTELKRGKWVGIDVRGAGNFSYTHVVNGDTTASYLRTATLTQEEQKVRGPEYFRIWRSQFSATHENPVTLYGVALHMSKRRHIENAL